MAEPTTFEEALGAARTVSALKSAMAMVEKPRSLNFVELMRDMGEAERVAKLSGTTPEGLLQRLAGVDRAAVATAERLNLTTHPQFLAAVAAVFAGEALTHA